MSSAYTTISDICRAVDICRSRIANERGLFWWLNRAFARDDLAPHPDDVVELDARMANAANTLLELAHEIQMQRVTLKANALQYELETIEAAQ